MLKRSRSPHQTIGRTFDNLRLTEQRDSTSVLADQAGEHVADRCVDDGVGEAVEGGWFAVDDHELRSAAHGSGHDAGDGVDREARPDGEQQIGLVGCLLGTL